MKLVANPMTLANTLQIAVYSTPALVAVGAADVADFKGELGVTAETVEDADGGIGIFCVDDGTSVLRGAASNGASRGAASN